MDEIRQFIQEMGVESMIFESPSYETAFVGVEMASGRAVYDFEMMVDYLVAIEDMTAEEAVDFIEYNSSSAGEDHPIIIKRFEGGM